MASKSLKTPKGTRDWYGSELLLRDHIIQTISKVLHRHNATPLDTPVFELTTLLASKYGEDSKLIYDLSDQGGEATSLRYDLTVPFARWLAMHSNIQNIKRYSMAKVYRRDQPSAQRGRMREFSQCDLDIAGVYDAMVPDAEVLCVVKEVFTLLGMGVTIKLNHRKVLDGMFAVAGVPADKIRTTSSAVDKLDKASWAEIRKELLEKGLTEQVADRVGGYVLKSGSLHDMIQGISQDESLITNESIAAGMADLTLLSSYLEAMDVLDIVSFDLSLARGLDYYTGLIYEIIPNTDESRPSQVGSIAAGGRYDNLVGMYCKREVPCVGISFGIDRIFTLLNAQREKRDNDHKSPADVFIVSLGGKDSNGFLRERMKVARLLWDADIQAEYIAKVTPKSQQQFNAASGARIAVLLGQDELEASQVRLRRLYPGVNNATVENRGKLVARDNLVEEVQVLLAAIEGEESTIA